MLPDRCARVTLIVLVPELVKGSGTELGRMLERTSPVLQARLRSASREAGKGNLLTPRIRKALQSPVLTSPLLSTDALKGDLRRFPGL
jgi:hypothetical protein